MRRRTAGPAAAAAAAAELLVDAEEHGEGDDKVYGVESRADGVGEVPVFEGVVGEVGDGECFHEGSDVSQREDGEGGN